MSPVDKSPAIAVVSHGFQALSSVANVTTTINQTEKLFIYYGTDSWGQAALEC